MTKHTQFGWQVYERGSAGWIKKGQLVETEVEGRGIKESIPQMLTAELSSEAWVGISQEKWGYEYVREGKFRVEGPRLSLHGVESFTTESRRFTIQCMQMIP